MILFCVSRYADPALADPLIVSAAGGAVAAGVLVSIVCLLLTIIIVCTVCKQSQRNKYRLSRPQDNTDGFSVYGEEFLQPYLYSPDDVIV